MTDIVVTPASGNIQFYNTTNTTIIGAIYTTSANNLVIAAQGGVTYGNTSADVNIGTGASTVNIVYPISGAIRAASGSTLTLGGSGSFVNFGGNVTSGIVSTVGTAALTLSNGTSNWVQWVQGGVAAPSFTTRSAGTKLVLWPSISASSVDYAIGIESGTMWFSTETTSANFRWYGGTTQLMTLAAGNLGIGNTSPSHRLSVNGTAYFAGTITSGAASGVNGLDFSVNDVYANMRVIRNSGGAANDGMYIGFGNAGTGTTKIYGGGAVSAALEKFSTYTLEPGSFRAPIFEDSDNTGYYLNPAGESRINIITADSLRVLNGGVIMWRHDSAALNNKFWDTYSDSAGVLRFRAVNDAYNSATEWLNVTRSGQTPQLISLYADTNIPTNSLSFGSSVRQMINLWSTSFGIGIQNSTQYFRSGGRFSWFIGGVHSTSENDPGSGGVSAMTLTNGNLTVSGTVNSTIFNDSNDSAYYCDPNSISNFVRLRVLTPGTSWIGGHRGDAGIVSSTVALSDSYHGWFSQRTPAGGYSLGTLNNNFYLTWGTNANIDGNNNNVSFIFTIDSAGNFTALGNVTAYSDIKLKENIEPISNAISKIKQIRGVTFTRNDQEDKNARYAGVIAQEVEKVLPEVVSENEEGIKTVAYGNMVGLLIEAIKELSSEVEMLKNKLGDK